MKLPKFETPSWFSKKEEAKNDSIEELREPLRILLKELRAHIEKGDYGLVIGEDASGRIPALVLDKVIRARYANRFLAPKTLFVSGSRNLTPDQKKEKQKKIVQFLEKAGIPSHYAKRALVVTDTISSGVSLEPLTRALNEMNIRFDIASVGGGTSGERGDERQERLGGNIYYGQTNTPNIYGKRGLSGVSKDSGELHSVPVKEAYSPLGPPLVKEELRESINEARDDVRILSEQLLKKY